MSRMRLISLLLILAAFAAIPPVAFAIGEPFYVTLFSRIMIFAIAALSLDLILGYGGMVSFGHAAYLGTGGYAVAILAFYGFEDGFLQLLTAIVFSGLVAAAIGYVCIRTSGVYFIMITLAFTQMLFYLGISLEEYGGDDGINTKRSTFFGHRVFNDDVVLYYAIFAVLLIALYVLWRFVNSRFGMVVRGSMSNDRRMQAIGFKTFRYRLVAFVISGIVCGIAGFFLANLTKFVTPEYMNWFRSGEIMVMVIMGGMGTLFGAVFGAAALLLLEELLSDLTQHWQAILGPILVLLVLFAKRGIWGILPDRSSRDG